MHCSISVFICHYVYVVGFVLLQCFIGYSLVVHNYASVYICSVRKIVLSLCVYLYVCLFQLHLLCHWNSRWVYMHM